MSTRPSPPTSVRDMMQVPRSGGDADTVQQEAGGADPAPPPVPRVPGGTREVRVDGVAWVVRVVGQTRVASRADSGPRLLSVSVESAGGRRVNAGDLNYVVGRQLNDVPESTLIDLVRGAIHRAGSGSGG